MVISERIGIVVTSLGRPTILRLLTSLAEGVIAPSVVSIADQSPTQDIDVGDRWPFDVKIVRSSGGASAGRNDAMAEIPSAISILGFPNDDSSYPSSTLAKVLAEFDANHLDGVACTLLEGGRPRFSVPANGHTLTRRTVWRAIEAATFIRFRSVTAAGGFSERLGTGCGTPWQSGEITDLLLRMIATGAKVGCLPDCCVEGPGERRNLSDSEYLEKVRRYNRGAGRVYGLHSYRFVEKWGFVAMPWFRLAQGRSFSSLEVRAAGQRTLGRAEGVLGRVRAN